MRKAHFIALAQVLADFRNEMPAQTFEMLLVSLAEALSAANPAFSAPQFFAAARTVPFVKRQAQSKPA